MLIWVLALPLALAAWAMACSALRRARRLRKGGSPFPSPPGLPVLGHYSHLFPFDGSPGRLATIHDAYTEVASKIGPNYLFLLPFHEVILSHNMFHTADPRNVEHMLKLNADNYPKGAVFRGVFRDLLGGGIFNSDGPDWLVQRKCASHEFSVSRFKHFMSTVFGEHAAEMCGVVEGRLGGEVELQRLFSKFTLESIARIAFGVSLGCIRADIPFERAT